VSPLFVTDHARFVVVVSESNDDDTILFAQNCLVDGPTRLQMGKHVTHDEEVQREEEDKTRTVDVQR
jgi:hypothetical protein